MSQKNLKTLLFLLLVCTYVACACQRSTGATLPLPSAAKQTIPPERRGTISEISDSLMQRMRAGGSWKTGTPASLRASLRLLRLYYVDAEGRTQQGEMVVDARIARDVVEIFDSLYSARYPVARIALIDEYGADDERSMAANNTSAFNYRTMTGSSTGRPSLHAQGLAIDLNPLWNPYVKGSVVKPKGARRTPQISHADLAYRLFRDHGFRWGGDWRTVKDYQHFEKTSFNARP